MNRFIFLFVFALAIASGCCYADTTNAELFVQRPLEKYKEENNKIILSYKKEIEKKLKAAQSQGDLDGVLLQPLSQRLFAAGNSP